MIPVHVYILLMLDYFLSFVTLLPLKDDRGRYRSFPYMTLGLVVINVAVYAFVYWALPGMVDDQAAWEGIVFQFLKLPVAILEGQGLGALSMVTSAFMHANFGHLFGNMLYLIFFGRKLEDVLGPVKFGLFYLVCAFFSGIFSVLGEMALPLVQGEIPGLGASGAIMGLVGAYLFLYHQERIRTLAMLFIIPIPFAFRMPTWGFIIYTVARDLIRGMIEREVEQSLGVIYSLVGFFAHLGGILAGLTCLYFFLPAEIIHYRHRVGE